MMHQDKWWCTEYTKEQERKKRIKRSMQVTAVLAILYVISVAVHYYVGA